MTDEKNEFDGKRHFGLWQKKNRVALLGFSKAKNNVLAVLLDHLPEDERNELVRIALNSDIQTKYELVSTLYNTRHSKSGDTWMTNIVSRLRRNDGSVCFVYVKNLDQVEPNQMAYYKGYRPSDAPAERPEDKLYVSEAEKAAVLGDDYRQLSMRSTGTRSGDMNPAQEQDFSTPSGGDATAAALSQLASVMAQMVDKLGKIEEKVSPKPPRANPPRTKTPPKPIVLTERTQDEVSHGDTSGDSKT